MKLQKETLCLQAFIVKRVFIFNSIAFKTGHFLEMVWVSEQNTVIAVNWRWAQDIQGKDINKTRKLIDTWIMLQ